MKRILLKSILLLLFATIKNTLALPEGFTLETEGNTKNYNCIVRDDHQRAVGNVRFRRSSYTKIFYIDINLTEGYRRRGLAAEIYKESERNFKKYYEEQKEGSIPGFLALISSPANYPSIKLFLNLGMIPHINDQGYWSFFNDDQTLKTVKDDLGIDKFTIHYGAASLSELAKLSETSEFKTRIKIKTAIWKDYSNVSSKYKDFPPSSQLIDLISQVSSGTVDLDKAQSELKGS